MLETNQPKILFCSFGHLDFATGNPPRRGGTELPERDEENLNLPFNLAQGGESFDSAQDREPVERLVEPFRISILGFRIFSTLGRRGALV